MEDIHVLGIQVLCLDGLDTIHFQIKDTNAARGFNVLDGLDACSVAVSGKFGRFNELAPRLHSVKCLAGDKKVGFSLGLSRVAQCTFLGSLATSSPRQTGVLESYETLKSQRTLETWQKVFF